MNSSAKLYKICQKSFLTLFFFLACATSSSYGQDIASLNTEITQRLDQALVNIDIQLSDMASIERHSNEANGLLQEVLKLRLEREQIKLMEMGVEFAEAVRKGLQEGAEIEGYALQVIEILSTHESIADEVWHDLERQTVFPETSLGAAEQAAAYQKIFVIQTHVEHVIDLRAANYAMQKAFDLDVSALERIFHARLRERAINVSVYLDIAVAEAEGINAGLAVLPSDTELTAKLGVANERIAEGAIVLARAVNRLRAIGADVTAFQEQLITTTGEITPELFDVGVISRLLGSWSETLIELLSEEGPTFIFQILLFILIIYICRKLSKLSAKLVKHGLKKSKVDLSQLLHKMIVSAASNLVMALGILIALSQVGISLGPLLAGLGIAGFVIGFALQDSLSNFASGMMILFYRPFDVGDLVDLSGVFGRVDQMSLVNTTVLTLDNQRITLPNNMIWAGVIKNVTAQKVRRVDMTFGIAYTDDIELTERVLKELIDAHPLVLQDPEPQIKLHELGESSVNFIVWPWAKTADYWDVYWDITRAVKMRFDQEGISIPFPQRDIHLISKHED